MSPLSAAAASAFSTSASQTLTSLAHRSLDSDLDSVKKTFSSWDSCMSKAYCKWPVIVAIIIASLIVLSLLSCAARCLCCGLECCCGCFACCNACCPSPRRRSQKDYSPAPQQAWPQQPPQPQPLPYQQPYQWQNPMSYGPPQTAVFDAPSRGQPVNGGMAANRDALPAMPSWATATNRHVEDTEYHGAGPEEEGIAMGAVGATGQQWRPQGAAAEDEQRVPMLAPQPQTPNPYGYDHRDGTVSPYAPQSPTAYNRDDLPSPTQPYLQLATSSYGQDHSQGYAGQGYGAGAAALRPNMTGSQPPSYQSRSPTSPTSAYTYTGAPSARQDYGQNPYAAQSPAAAWGAHSPPQVPRKPVRGSWREI